MEYKETVKKVIAEVCRLLLGVVFIFSGTVKAVDPMGGAIKIGDYLTSFGLDKLQPFTVLISFNLSALEFMLGVCMLLGVYRRYTTFLTLLMMSFMTPLTLYLAIFNPVSDCGCFGDALVISNWQTFYRMSYFWPPLFTCSSIISGFYKAIPTMSTGSWPCGHMSSLSISLTGIIIICRSWISVPISWVRISLP